MAEPFVIVGAGPVGLTMALLLARAGKEVRVLERDEALHTDWRASTFHPPSLEMAEEMGIVDRMLEQGLVAAKYQVRDWRQGRVAEFDFTALSDVTKYPFRLQLEQYKYSRIIFEDLCANYPNVKVRFSQKVVEVRTDDERPAVTIKHTDQDSSEVIACDWLMGTDGANSVVRQSLRVSFEGLTYPIRQLLLSVDAPLLEWYPDICLVNYVADSDEAPGMILKIPDVWRVSFAIPDDISDQEAVDDDYVMSRIRSVFGNRTMPLPTERQIFKVHQRAASTFRQGNILLLGDAAHINSPHGGMGLNSGIHDAYDLARTLLPVVNGHAPESDLDAWAERRRNVAVNEVQRVSHRNTTQFGSKDEKMVSASLQHALTIAADVDRAREWMLEASMLASVRPWYAPADSNNKWLG